MTVEPLSAELKARTTEHHVRAERHPLQGLVARGAIDRATWGRLVAQNRTVQEAMERALDDATVREPRISAVFTGHHRRMKEFDADLKALNVSGTDGAPMSAAQQMAAWISGLGEREPLALLGVLYVIEGATNGGQFLSRAVGPALGVGPGAPGVLSLDPHGPATRELWGKFRTSVDALNLGRAEKDGVIAAACETFDGLTRVFDSVQEAGSGSAASAPQR